jgi:hypothetical protein
MSNKINRNSRVLVTIAASDKLAIYSKDIVTVSQSVGYPNIIPGETVLFNTVAEVEYVSAAFTVETDIIIDTGDNVAYYNAGTGPIIIERRGIRGQGAPGVLNATGALTAAMILAGIVTSTTATVTATLPTGTVMDAAVEMAIGESFDWSCIKTGANTLTVAAAASGHTVIGDMAVVTVTSSLFRTRKTAAATYVTYRISI